MKGLIFLTFAVIAVSSCKKGGGSKLTPECDGSHPTYNSQIKVIIEGNCNASGCHNAGSSRGDFTTYTGLSGVIASGAFKREVLTDQTMPKGSANLSQKNLNLIQCWVNDGYPEN